MENNEVLKDQCECGGTTFSEVESWQVYYDLEDGVLTASGKDGIGSDGVMTCTKCGKEYSPANFVTIQ